MKIDVQHIDSTRKRVRVQISSERVQEKRDSIFRSMLGQANIKGFRKGKVPHKVLESMYGEEINRQTVSDLVSETLEGALLEKSLVPVNRPNITEIDKVVFGSEFSYSAEFEVIPEFELADYSSIPLKKKIYKVSDEDVEKSLEKLRQDAAQLQLTKEDRLTKEGDYIKMLSTITLEDGSVIRKDSTTGMVLKEKNLVEQTEDILEKELNVNLIGKKTGETTQFTIRFQEDFQLFPEIAGKTVTFYVTIKGIYDRTIPELDDDFAKNIGRQNMDEAREALRQHLESLYEQAQMESMMNQLAEYLVRNNPFDLPNSLVEETRKNYEDNIIAAREKRALVSDGSVLGLNDKESTIEIVTTILKVMVILNRIADKEGIDVQRFEVDDEIRRLARPETSNPEEQLKVYSKNQDMMGNIEQDTRKSKVLEFLLEKAVIEEVSFEQFSIDNEQSSQ